MAELLRVFDETIRDEATIYRVQVAGRQASDGMWEGWLEFVPLDNPDVAPFITPVESRQPGREHLAYWASGLSMVYAEGALDRARGPVVIRTRVERPVASAPAPRKAVVHETTIAPPIFDPFDVGARSLDILEQELHALGRGRLLHIVAAYHLNPDDADLAVWTDAELVAFIVNAVDERLSDRNLRTVR